MHLLLRRTACEAYLFGTLPIPRNVAEENAKENIGNGAKFFVAPLHLCVKKTFF
jgi:hypothetical protein